MNKLTTAIACLLAEMAVNAASYADYCRDVRQLPGLIRFYSFAEGKGDEIANAAPSPSDRIAVTGGPFGSMSLVRVNPHGWRSEGRTRPTEVSSAWIADGRHPGKFSLRSGTTLAAADHSAVSGRELTKGFTFALWIRPTGERKEGRTELLHLGDGGKDGFHLDHEVYGWCPQGRYCFYLGAPDKKNRVDLKLNVAAPGSWHFVACTLGDGFCRVYGDGAVAEVAYTNALLPKLTTPYPSLAQQNELDERLGGWGGTDHLRLGYNFNNQTPEIVDYDELMIFDRPLAKSELDALYAAGKPAASVVEQQTATAAFNADEAVRREIVISVPDDTSGYFRIGSPISIAVTLPKAPLFAAAHRVEIACEQMSGQFRKCETKSVKGGESALVSFTPPQCGVYFIDVTVSDAAGKVVRRLDPSRTIAVTTPAPKGELTTRNPIGVWAFNNDFSYDSTVRRMFFLGPGDTWFKGDWRESARKQFAAWKSVTPGVRTFVCFGYPTKGKLLSKMPADERAKWEKYFHEVADFLPEVNCYAVEFMSEPDCNRTTPESARETVKYVGGLIRERHPEIKLVPAGACPSGLPWTDRMIDDGLAKLIDGISWHSYRGNPLHELNRSDPMKPQRAIFAKHPGKTFECWNTESGYDYLPRIGRRPMNHAEARSAGYAVGMVGGYEMFTTSMPCAPEDEAAAMQVQAIIVELALGYKSYAKCVAPGCKTSPSLQGVAWTALAGQVLNHQTGVRRVPLASLDRGCFLVSQDDGSHIAALCGMVEGDVNLKVEPSKTYRTMDMLGNFGKIKSDDGGLINLKVGMNPFYVFGVPATLSESSVLSIDLPKKMPDEGVLSGNVTVANESKHPLKGTLVPDAVRGLTITPTATQLEVAPGETKKIPFTVKAKSLRNRTYVVGFSLKDGSRTTAAASAPFESDGTTVVLRPLKSAPDPKAGDAAWKGIPEQILDDLEDVTHGQPNLACLWNPHWEGPKDLSTRLQLGWVKDDAIYFRLRVRDNVVFPAPTGANNEFCYDCLELFTDTRPVREQGTPRSAGADQTLLPARDSAAFAPVATRSCCAMGTTSAVTVSGVGRRTSEGYEIWGKISPVADSPFRVRAGSRLRLDFTINDADTPEALRKSAMTYHGQFSNYVRVDFWGKYELGLED